MSSRRDGPAARNAAAALAATLSRELDLVRGLAEAVDRQRKAVEAADAERLRGAAIEVRERLASLADRARERETAISRLGLPTGSGIEAVVEHLRGIGVDAEGIERLGSVLRREAEATMRSVSIVRDSAERLAAHLAGLRRLVHAPAAGTYGRGGRLPPSDRPLAVDVRH